MCFAQLLQQARTLGRHDETLHVIANVKFLVLALALVLSLVSVPMVVAVRCEADEKRKWCKCQVLPIARGVRAARHRCS